MNKMSNDEHNSDYISKLPSDKVEPTTEESELINSLFPHKKPHKIMYLKETLIIGLLFFIISLPQIDSMVTKIIPTLNNKPYALLLLKMLILMTVFWFFNIWSAV